MKQRILITIYSLIISLSFYSCKKFIEVPTPPEDVIGDDAFADDATATSAVTGLYTRIMGNSGSGQMFTGATSIYLGLSADELNFLSSSQSLIQQYQEFFYNSISPSSSNFWPRFWQNPYNYIFHTNACIEGLKSTHSLTENVRKQLLGEMLFVRSFIYFYMVNEFGDVPLILSTEYRTNSKMPRTSESQVYAQIIDDLLESGILLSNNYPSQGRARPNKWAATALLARVYLYQKNWTNAISSATEVISSGQYGLVNQLNNAFLLNSNEAILQFPTSTTSIVNTYEGNLLIPSSTTSIPSLSITSTLYNAFEAGDLRKTSWLKSNVVSGQTYYYPFKYKLRSNTTPATEATIILRYAELFLIRAEAQANLNNISQAQADLNVIRSRAGLPNTTANTQPLLLLAIEKERQTELFAEWGHRWLDLKRTGKANSILISIKGANWQLTDVLYPIPEYELRRNPFLTQNPGY